MRSKQELFWCEVLIKSVLAFAPVEFVCTGAAAMFASSERNKAQQKAGLLNTTLRSNMKPFPRPQGGEVSGVHGSWFMVHGNEPDAPNIATTALTLSTMNHEQGGFHPYRQEDVALSPPLVETDMGMQGHIDKELVQQKTLRRVLRLKATWSEELAFLILPSRSQRLEVGAKLIPWKLAPIWVGIACTSTVGALLENRYAVAAPCCVNAVSMSGGVAALKELDSLTDAHFNHYQRYAFNSTAVSQPESFIEPRFEQERQKACFDALSSCLVETGRKQELASDSSLHLTQETSLQAQSPTTSPTTPPTSPANPNQERFLQPPLTPAPAPSNSQPPVPSPPTPAPVQPPATPAPQTAPSSQTIQVQKIEVTGSTIFASKQLDPIVRPYQGRSLTLDQLNEVAAKITQLYLNQGYITSRAILVDQAVTNGVVQIRVIEGGIEEIRIEGTRRVNPNYIRARVKLGAGTPVSTAKLEDQLRLLRADPLFENVEASLRAGNRLGQSILIVRVTEANPFEGSVGIDNYSPPSVGSERLGANALYRNLTGNGDALAGAYYHTTQGGSDDFEFSYRLPVNPMNGAIQLRTLITNNKIIDPSLTFADIQGDSELYEISFQQPLVRSPREEFALSVGFTAQNSKSESIFAFPGILISPGADAKGFTDTRVFKFGQDYVRRDVSGAWSLRSLFSFGADFLGATLHPHPTPDGRFFSWLGQVQRVQILDNNNLLIMGADIQLTPDSLVPSQQFVIGGGQSLRGYRQNIRAGDNGVRFTIEDRLTLERNESGSPTFQLAPFFDAGYVWNVDDNPTNRFLPSQRFLAGLGFGIIWQPEPQLSIRFDYGYPLVDLKDRGENAQDNGLYFSVRYLF